MFLVSINLFKMTFSLCKKILTFSFYKIIFALILVSVERPKASAKVSLQRQNQYFLIRIKN